MVNVTRDDILKLAKLSQVSLTENEAKEFENEITDILDYIDQLSSVNVSGLEPTYQVTGLSNVMRSDEIIDYGYSPQDLVDGAINSEDNQLKVKRMIG